MNRMTDSEVDVIVDVFLEVNSRTVSPKVRATIFEAIRYLESKPELMSRLNKNPLEKGCDFVQLLTRMSKGEFGQAWPIRL